MLAEEDELAGLVRGNQAGWGSAEVLGALIAGGLLGAGFLASERRASEPMVPVFPVPEISSVFWMASRDARVLFGKRTRIP